jgi:signal peptide peptidase SppA
MLKDRRSGECVPAHSRLLDIMNGCWAILPSYLEEIQEIYKTHLRGDKIDLSSVEAAIGKPLSNNPKPYEVADGVATIYVEGIIARKASLLTSISGGLSTDKIARDLAAAASDTDVKCVLLYIDSPGGEALGIQNLAAQVRKMSAKKPVVAFTDGQAASAAYWIASSAQRFYASGNDNDIGSVGVYMRHVDVSKAEEMAGRKTTEIYAGKYKTAGSQFGPLSDEARQMMQDNVDYFYSLFTEDVAAYRGLSLEKMDKWADGRVFKTQAAIKAGLVDGVSTKERVMARLAKDGGSFILRERIEAEIAAKLQGGKA